MDEKQRAKQVFLIIREGLQEHGSLEKAIEKAREVDDGLTAAVLLTLVNTTSNAERIRKIDEYLDVLDYIETLSD